MVFIGSRQYFGLLEIVITDPTGRSITYRRSSHQQWESLGFIDRLLRWGMRREDPPDLRLVVSLYETEAAHNVKRPPNSNRKRVNDMDNAPTSGTIPGMLVSTPTTDQELHIGPLIEQLNLYWNDSQYLRHYVQALQTELWRIQRENTSLRHDYATERRRHAQTRSEVARLNEQFQRLSAMLSNEGKDAPGVVSVFLELEGRSMALQQAEFEICKWAGAMRAACQRIEDSYSNSPRNPPNCPVQTNGPYQPRLHREVNTFTQGL
ncbi:hypothetical protein CNMCM5793_004995 [Aspergillus hiratsukae]|uniref:Uncharacterized protein n=1 Tax=Aspergillus hiratsukae TaxID=1194566 RepID=A0A8H6QI32_9EURO|nr:hypothetical protein CNMCM5793_004995 [Aspergillus hiratsukae]KAF7173408.1 hypothetical protein CNMCM6106_007490 [Aspergillus hiratsukae]